MSATQLDFEEQMAIDHSSRILKCARKIRNIRQTELSGILGIRQGTVSKIENGILLISSYHWFKACRALRVDMATIETGHLNNLTCKTESLPELIKSFKIPPRYRKDQLLTVREIYTILKIFRDNLDSKDWHSLVRQELKMDADYFVHLDHPISTRLLNDLLGLIKDKQKTLKVDKLAQKFLLQDSLVTLHAEQIVDSKKLIQTYVQELNNKHHGFTYSLQKEINQIEIKASSAMLESFPYLKRSDYLKNFGSQVLAPLQAIMMRRQSDQKVLFEQVKEGIVTFNIAS